MRRALLIACVLLAAASCGKAPTWEALPLGTSADFSDLFFTDANHGWIAGGASQITGGLVGRTVDAGKTWRFTSNLTARERMTVPALHMLDAARGVVATGSGAILRTTDGGESWTPAVRKGRVNALSSLFFLDERRGWAAGTGDVLFTDDAGETWMPVTPTAADTSYKAPVRAIQFQDDRHGWIAGNRASLMRTADGGVTWEAAATPLTPPDHPTLWDIFFVDAQTGWVVGDEGTILATRDGGRTWTRQETGLKDAQSAAKLEQIPRAGGVTTVDAGDRTPGLTITAVRFVDARRGWITGFYAGLGRSLILETQDGGATWTVDADVPGEELHALFVQGGQQVWAIGARVRPGPQSIYRRVLTAK